MLEGVKCPKVRGQQIMNAYANIRHVITDFLSDFRAQLREVRFDQYRPAASYSWKEREKSM